MFCYFKVSADILFPSLLYLNIWNLVSSPSPPLTLQKAGHTTGSQQVKPNTMPLNTTEFSDLSAEDTALGWSDSLASVPCTSGKYPAKPISVMQWEQGSLWLPWVRRCVQAHPHGVQKNWAISEKANGTGSTGLSHTGCPGGVQEAGQLHQLEA